MIIFKEQNKHPLSAWNAAPSISQSISGLQMFFAIQKFYYLMYNLMYHILKFVQTFF